jgi:hypothetical protein
MYGRNIFVFHHPKLEAAAGVFMDISQKGNFLSSSPHISMTVIFSGHSTDVNSDYGLKCFS